MINSEKDNDLVILFGEKVRKVRQKQNITQAQLAFETNMSREQIVRIEKGKINTTIKRIEAIAEALNVHPKDLFDFEV